MITVEELAKSVIVNYGKTASWSEIDHVLRECGVADDSGDLSREILDLISTAIVNVRLRVYR